ncbi:ExbD/TolR family protein [Pararobbsia silviterrae]|uniref:Biopolymer transporter ExbD n=1 Tax=Pararobbsia silviterrae TaxID=1792498 RepID=A0A494YAF4_9BURK|nr:biopolymer transporter ExbD [Pararobbsia silviterrae]RKP57615.1 biopolymer transporter ExbD [Pararobbsia silviterrae]
MSFYSPPDDVMNEINMTPLIDVMLVLLIVFMVTLPAMTNTVKLDLPTATSTPTGTPPPHVVVAVQADGSVHWDNETVDAAALSVRLAGAAQRQPQPDIQIYADKAVRYEAVADVLAATQRAGLTNIDFVTQPAPN